MLVLRSWVFCALFLTLVSSSYSLGRILDAGWNLVSVPVHSGSDISNYLDQNLTGTVVKIWTYDGGWKKYEPGESSNGLTQFQKNRAVQAELTDEKCKRSRSANGAQYHLCIANLQDGTDAPPRLADDLRALARRNAAAIRTHEGN